MKKKNIDLTQGPIAKNLIRFSIPILLSSLLQQLYSTVDLLIVGRYAGQSDMAAIGATSSLSYLILAFFFGLSLGTSILTSQFYSSKREEKLYEVVHTSLAIAIYGGLALTIITYIAMPLLLQWMDTPQDIFMKANNYMRVYLIGVVPMLVYNIGSGILRSVGDSRRPFYFLGVSALLNILLDLLFVNGTTGSTKVVLNEKDKAYVDVTDNLTFLADNSFIWSSEKDGFNHLYHYDKSGKQISQITKGKWEVTNYYGLNEATKTIFYQSVENGSINRDVYSIGLDGKNKKRLSAKTGTSSATFSPNFAFYINTFSDAKTPTIYSLNDANSGKEIQIIRENEALLKRLDKYNLPSKEFFELQTEKGQKLNAWMIKPKNFDASKKYPLLMYLYNGPGSQQVKNSSFDFYFW